MDDFDQLVQLSPTPLIISDSKGLGWDAHDNGPLSPYVQRHLSDVEYVVALSHQQNSSMTETSLFTPDDAETLGGRLIASAQAVRARRAAAERP